jgi:hypothetical protein
MFRAKGSDVHPGVAGLRRAAFAQQAWNNAHCFIERSGVRPGVRRGPGLLQRKQEVRCMLWRPSGFQGMKFVKCTAKASDVCPVSFGFVSFPRQA